MNVGISDWRKSLRNPFPFFIVNAREIGFQHQEPRSIIAEMVNPPATPARRVLT